MSASIVMDAVNSFSASEHEVLANKGPLMGQFHGVGIANANDPAQYQASIDWHDGTVTKAKIATYQGDPSDPAILYATVGDPHTFGDPGNYVYTVTINQVGHPEVSATGDSAYTVDDYALHASGKAAYANSGTNQLRNLTVATFDDGEPGNGFTDATGTASNFAATIAWGDGTVGTGAIVATAVKGHYNIVGSHTYNSIKGQTFWLTIHVTDKNGGADATTHGAAIIYNAPVIQPINVVTAPLNPFSTTPVDSSKVWN